MKLHELLRAGRMYGLTVSCEISGDRTLWQLWRLTFDDHVYRVNNLGTLFMMDDGTIAQYKPYPNASFGDVSVVQKLLEGGTHAATDHDTHS